jgi:hypothetical protein
VESIPARKREYIITTQNGPVTEAKAEFHLDPMDRFSHVGLNIGDPIDR